MSIFSEFTSDGNSFCRKDDPINEVNWDSYIAKYGNERAAGYLDALSDVIGELHEILHPEIKATPETPNLVRKNLRLFTDHKKMLFEKLLNHIRTDETVNDKTSGFDCPN